MLQIKSKNNKFMHYSNRLTINRASENFLQIKLKENDGNWYKSLKRKKHESKRKRVYLNAMLGRMKKRSKFDNNAKTNIRTTHDIPSQSVFKKDIYLISDESHLSLGNLWTDWCSSAYEFHLMVCSFGLQIERNFICNF